MKAYLVTDPSKDELEFYFSEQDEPNDETVCFVDEVMGICHLVKT